MNPLFILAQQDWIRTDGALDWFPETNSAQAGTTDLLGAIILWLSAFCFIAMMGAMIAFVIKYRRRPGVAPQRSASHNTILELAWSIIPLLILVVIFFMGFEGYMTKIAAPVGAEEIYITGAQWSWSAKYRNGREAGVVEGEMVKLEEGNPAPEVPIIYVPVDTPVKLIMNSKDVIHSFFIPDFRTKMDVFPNRYTSLWFRAEEKDKQHVVFCAEYCGQNHSEMAAIIHVVSWDKYVEKINERGTMVGLPISVIGERLRARRGCATCHAIDGSPGGTGPSWKATQAGDYGWGTPRQFADGSSIPSADENYFRDAILNPSKQVVAGFEDRMPPQMGMSEEEVRLFIDYIKFLNGEIEDYEYLGNYGAPGGAAGAAGSN